MASVAPTESDAFSAIKTFLDWALPGVPAVRGQVNRVPEPKSANHVVVWPIYRRRLSTNVREDDDVEFTASIAGNLMTVTAVVRGAIAAGATVFGTGVAPGTAVVGQLSGMVGGVGVYQVTGSQALASGTLSAGAINISQSTEFIAQMDVYGPASGNNAQILSTLLRDPSGMERFGPGVVPLFSEDPRQAPFVDAENQWEDRWVVEAHMQIKPIVSVPQEYASIVVLDVVNVDAAYPP